MNAMRSDIPSATPRSWQCAVCQTAIDSESEQYQTPGGQTKTRYIPASRYWNGYGTEVFCSSDCSCNFKP